MFLFLLFLNRLKRLFVPIIALLSMLTPTAQVSAVTNLKGTLSCLDEKYIHLSRYKGMISTTFVRNLWHYGNTKDKTVQLIKKLFNEVNQDGQFLPSEYDVTKMPLARAMQLYFSLPLHDPNTRADVACELLTYYKNPLNKKDSSHLNNIKEWLMIILEDLAKTDTVFYEALSAKIIDLELYDAKNDDDFFSKYLLPFMSILKKRHQSI